MKNLQKVVLLVALVLCSTQLFAQSKLGVINSQDLIVLMPETTEMEANIRTLQADLQSTSETMQVEWNTKLSDYQANMNTMTDSVRNLKEKDLQDLRTRISEFEQNAMQELQYKQQQLLQPIIAKATEAINSVAAEQGLAMVFDTSAGTVIYTDPAQTVDLLSAVKAKLGITE